MEKAKTVKTEAAHARRMAELARNTRKERWGKCKTPITVDGEKWNEYPYLVRIEFEDYIEIGPLRGRYQERDGYTAKHKCDMVRLFKHHVAPTLTIAVSVPSRVAWAKTTNTEVYSIEEYTDYMSFQSLRDMALKAPALSGEIWEGMDFSGIRMESTAIYNGKFLDCNFDGANFTNCAIDLSTFHACNMRHCTFFSGSFNHTHIGAESDLTGWQFYAAPDTEEADFSGSNLPAYVWRIHSKANVSGTPFEAAIPRLKSNSAR